MRRVYYFVYKIQDLVIEQLYRRQSIFPGHNGSESIWARGGPAAKKE